VTATHHPSEQGGLERLRRSSVTVPVGSLSASVAAGVLLGIVSRDAPWVAALTLVLAGALAVRVAAPWGGSVPLGYTLAAALPALPSQAGLVLPAAIALVAGTRWVRVGPEAAGETILRLGPPCIGALAAVAAVDAVYPGAPVLPRVLASVVALLATDAVVTRRVPRSERLPLLEALPVYLTLGCGAALVAVATAGFGVVMALVAAFPVLITRFSFQRYAAARETLDQTVQALGLVPEMAGLIPVGHSERAAVYAAAVADTLRLGRGSSHRIVTATRLHHLGGVPYDPGDPDEPAQPPEPLEVAAGGARILREAGFPEDVADLVQQAAGGGLDGEAPSLEAAVVRVAGSFDDVVRDDDEATSRGLAAVSAAAAGTYDRRAVAALLQATASRPDLVPTAVASGARFAEAASGIDFGELVGAGGTIIPFVRRRR
jgi:hypothetical protein